MSPVLLAVVSPSRSIGLLSTGTKRPSNNSLDMPSLQDNGMLRTLRSSMQTTFFSIFTILTVVGADFLREVARSVPVFVVSAHVPWRGAHEAERDCRPVGPARGARRRYAHRHGGRRRPGRAVDGVICLQGGKSKRCLSTI